MVDLRKGKEQAGVVGPDFIYESLQYYTSHYHEHDTEKYREFPGVYIPVRKVGYQKVEHWDLGLGCIP